LERNNVETKGIKMKELEKAIDQLKKKTTK